MTAFASVFQALSRILSPPVHPTRLIAARRARLFAAGAAGGAAGLLLLAAYYATLGLLPPASAYPTTEYPVAAWEHRLDLAQFVGTLLYPPLPTPLTWWLGVTVLFGTFAGLGVVFAGLLAWSLQTSSAAKGLGFGVGLFLGLAVTLTVSNGLHPAIMRNTLPDTGLLLLGWSPLATLQLLLVHLLYGGTLGALYRRGTRTP